jgi:diguanylate cyclase (GGDEF)-like protein
MRLSKPVRETKAAALRRVRAGWVAVPIILVSFAALSSMPGELALVLRQLVFLTPLVVASASIAAIVLVAPGGDELRVWALVGVSSAVLFFSEAYFSAYQVFISAAGPPTPSASDVLNLAAGVPVVIALSIAGGWGRQSRPALMMFASDLVAVSAVAYAAIYGFWTAVLGAPGMPWQTGARWAAFSFLGALILTGLSMAARVTHPRNRTAAALAAASLSIFAVGLVVWPLWQGGGATVGPSVPGVLDNVLVLLGYCLMMMAALTRLSTVDAGWQASMGRPIDTDHMWQPSILSAVVLAGSAVMGAWAYQLPDGSGERGLYVAAASIAIMALVAHTGFASFEAGTLKDTSSTDPVTGALNHRSFQEECDQRILASRRRGVPFALVAIDLDGFARINNLLGHAAGDEALRAVVNALEAATGRSAKVFRLSGDEFGVIGAGVGLAQAKTFAAGLLAAISTVEPSPGLRLSASIGVVACDACRETKDELLRRADAAQVWAKYHGKGRVVAYDERIVRALGVEERMRLDEEHAYVGVVRALSAAADARDARNHYHSRNVAALAVLLAEAVGIDPIRTRQIEIAGILHDVGRIAMPDPVMPAFKRGQRASRADEEHAALGARLVESLGVDGMASWVRAHHERWDGGGFPDGLAGDAIPLEARVIALADAYDAMTAGRRGGASMSKSAALQEIDHGIGTRFDPVLAETFIEVVGRTASLGWSDEWPAA